MAKIAKVCDCAHKRGRYTLASKVVREAPRTMEQTEEARLAFLRNAWAAGQASGDAGPAEFADIKAQGRALLRRQASNLGVLPTDPQIRTLPLA